MKFSLAFLVALALSGAVNVRSIPVRNTDELNDVFQEFLDLVPKEEVLSIVFEYLEKDAEVRAIAEYVQTDEFRNLVRKVEKIEDVIKFYDYLQESGVDVYSIVNAMHQVIGLPPLVPGGSARSVKITGGIAGLVADIKAVLPLEEIKALYHKKLETSPAFAQLVERLRSPRFQELIDALRANAEFQRIVKFAKEHGVDVKAITDLLSTMLGLEFPSKHSRDNQDLYSDLMDFVALVPVDEVSAVFNQYLEQDAEVQAVLKYVESDDFRHLVQKVESIKDVINFYDYLEESGLNVYALVNAMHEAIGLPPLVPGGSARSVKITGGIAGLVADIKALLPLEDIKALYHKKLETSPAFAQLVKRLRSPRFQELINALRANAEFQRIVKFAKEHGVDVKAITDLLSTMLGLEFPSKHSRDNQDLYSDLMDFVALVPVDEVSAVFNQYLEQDAEVQAVLKYVESDDFRHLVQKVESIKDVINFYDYLEESGLNVYDLVNAMHEAIGLPPLVPGGSARSVKITGGIAGLVADIKALLPLEDIKALYHKKLETSPAFAQLVKRLRSPRFQELINALRANAEFQRIVKFAKEHGIDVKAITDLLSTMLGLEFPSKHSRDNQDLYSDLMDFVALVPVDEVSAVFNQYLEQDAEVQAVLKYVESDDFRHLVQKVESIKDVINFYDYLEESGLEVYDLVNAMHEAIGLPPLVPGGSARSVKITGGIAGLVADIKALLPLEDIKALYHKKLETSPAFAQLVKRLRSPRFQELINALRANAEFQRIVKFAKEHGIDVKAITDLLSTMLGLEFPNKHASQPLMTMIARNNLKDDLNDFLALLPTEKISEIVVDYMTNDKELIETMEYLQSPDFHEIVIEVEAMQEAKDVLAFLEESGLEAYEFLNTIHDIIGLPSFQPYARYNNVPFAATGGLAGLIADIKAILPKEEIKALYYQKLENSPSFVKLIKRLSSPEFQKFLDAVLEKKEARVIIAKLKGHGIDLQAVADLVSQVLGLHLTIPVIRVGRVLDWVNKELEKDLADFVDLLPAEELLTIAFDYVFNDPEVQKAGAFVKSPEFKKIAIPAQQNREFRRFVHYLDESGLPVSININKINRYLDLPEVVPSPLRRSRRAAGGVRGMLDAMEAVLPRAEIKALFQYKQQTSDAFKYMLDRLHAQEFADRFNELALNEDFRIFGFTAGSYGIDLDRIVGFFTKVLGIEHLGERSARSVDADLQEFINLVPAKTVKRIVTKYYLFDKEFKAAVAYTKSPAFAQLVRDLHGIPEYNELLTSLEEAGLDVPTYVAKIHDFIGFKGFRFSREERKTGGMAGFVSEIKATLPIADIKALYKHKMETSQDFAGLVELIKSNKFQAVTDALFANKIFQDILHRMQSHGIDLKAVSDFFLTVFGITTPPGVIDFFAPL